MLVGALVVTHGKLGEILVEEVEHLVGHQDRFRSLSTFGMSAETITDSVRNIIGVEPWIIFTDTPGTSPTIRSFAAIENNQAVISGANIGMLLSFIMHRQQVKFEELAEKMVRDGRRAVELKWSQNHPKKNPPTGI